jgi:hypothetical protein
MFTPIRRAAGIIICTIGKRLREGFMQTFQLAHVAIFGLFYLVKISLPAWVWRSR